MLFPLAQLRALTDRKNKSIPFRLKQGQRYAFRLEKPQIRSLEWERYAFSADLTKSVILGGNKMPLWREHTKCECTKVA